MHIRNLKQALNDGLVFKEIHRVIKFNKKALLKSYLIGIHSQERKQRVTLKNIFSSCWIMQLLEKLCKM